MTSHSNTSTPTLPQLKFVRALVDASYIEDPMVNDWVETDDGEVGRVVKIDSEKRVVNIEGKESDFPLDYWLYIQERPSLNAIWEDHQKNEMPDGICFRDAIPTELKEALQGGFEALLESKPDYHPGSGEIVRNLVHPSLFAHYNTSYKPETHQKKDVWGRPFEDSQYQWLPTNFLIDGTGRTTIDGEINNLKRSENEEMYGALGDLFSHFLSMFEGVYAYTKRIAFYDDTLEGEHELPESAPDLSDLLPLSLKNRALQVITKIVEYTLEDEEQFQGVWHVEGMSHEHILATGVCILSRDEDFEGGTLRFKRSYTLDEAGHLFWGVNQCRPSNMDELVDEGLVPIGSLETPAERMLVFPNSHIHKLSTMSVKSGASIAKRRVIVFWLVDPDHKILGMNDLERPQDSMSLEDAQAHRLSLMEERRVHKQTHNVRSVSLCEH